MNKLQKSAIIVDIDGTVAKMNGRSPYDYSKVSEDLPNRSVISIVEKFASDPNYRIVFVSGRPDSCRANTVEWINKNIELHFDRFELHMRETGDKRNDTIIKEEIYRNNIETNYFVHFVLDDRDKVVKMWRSIWLTCLQVAEWNF